MDEEIHETITAIRRRSGFCKSNNIFYSKRDPAPLPTNHSLNVTTFISSLPHNGQLAFIDALSGEKLTFSQLWNAVDSVSSSLYDLGVRKGHVVLLVSPNSIYFPVVCLSVMYIGAVITTANPMNTEQEISKQINVSKPFLVVTTPELLPKLSGSDPVVLMGGGADGCSIPPTVSQGVRVVGNLQEMMRKKSNRNKVDQEKVTLDDTATLLFSSGTTGEGKGVVSTHRNVITMIQLVIGRFRTHEKAQVYLAMIPMFHTFGMATFVLGLLSRGCPVVVLPRFNLDDVLTAVQRYKITYLPLAPPILVALINNADVINKKYDVQSWRYVLSGGAPLSKEVMEEFAYKFPNVTIFQGYALTESNGAGAGAETWEESRRFGSIGLLTASTEAKIVDPETGEALQENRSGELWLRGPSIMKGYLKNEEATAATLVSNGWLRTGDICYIDDDGFLFLVDRLKDLIKYNGYQVAPAELEAILLTHPDIVDAAVIPFPDKRVGQYPMAYVVRKTTSLSPQDVIHFISKQVAPYKKIRGVAFINSIPKNPAGKILRKNLIQIATSNI